MKRFLLIISIMILTAINAYSIGVHPDDLIVDRKTKYIFRLINGDIITGAVIDKMVDEKGLSLRINTIIGNSVIYEEEIAEIRLQGKHYRHKHRVFLLPTALPISDDHFIGNFELGLFYAGVGLGDNLSVTVGRSILPMVLPHQQYSVMNVKTSFHGVHFEDIPADIYFGLGGNLAFLNDDNRLIHFYGNASYVGDKSSVTAAIFYKAGSQDFAMIRFKNEFIDMYYPDGSFGVALGLDTKFSHRNDIRFIGEIWNSNINRPSSSLIMLGLRLAGTKFSSDFGLAFFMEPFAIPFFSFVWTPF